MIYGVQVRRVCWPIKHRNTMVIEPAFWNLFRQVPSPAGKWNQHLHKACQQKEAWSALKFPGRWLRWLWTSENTDDMAAQIITDCGNFTLDLKQHVFCSSPLFLQTLGPWFSFHLEMKTLLLCKSGFVALFLKMSERGDSWCTDSSFSSLFVKLFQVFESALLDSILKLASSLLLVHIFLPNFFLPVNFVFNMLWYSTPWTATLSVMTLCDLLSLWKVSMIIFWTIAMSAVFSIIVVSKNKRYPEFILYGW